MVNAVGEEFTFKRPQAALALYSLGVLTEKATCKRR
jgi:hypothetical protein